MPPAEGGADATDPDDLATTGAPVPFALLGLAAAAIAIGAVLTIRWRRAADR
ncbi:hypothetical protein OED01_02785 [Microbacterium sp. M28]|uniref:hypothetical protein n=1 Tax=Microbacterium sp. M28 TaxID=2962064 RepID=UPI0021F4B22F|nr:hypothetical protein [Microbacterium sp. M28]UYO97665.1 hypothetical protein OED01_02785 [Microbacterium sp. M28]